MNKTLNATIVTSLVLCLGGCGEKTLDFRNAGVSNGKIYRSGDDTPHTGKLTNIPLAKLPIDTLFPVSRVLTNVEKAPTYENLIAANQRSDKNINIVVCDVMVSSGWLSGNASCATIGERRHLFDLPFKKNLLDGKVTYYSLSSERKILEADFSSGKLNGNSKIFDAESGTVIHQGHWKDGVFNGIEEAFDAKTGNRIFLANIVNGVYDGEVSVYSADGTLIDKKILKAGVAQTSASDAATSAANVDACVSQWAAAYHKEKGEEAAVAADQMTEWDGWCKEGKRPIAQ